MVKSSGALACRDRAVLIEIDAGGDSKAVDVTPPVGCVTLYSGERLIDRPEVGFGFAEHMEVERADSTVLFVHREALVADPGIGSVTDDRPE